MRMKRRLYSKMPIDRPDRDSMLSGHGWLRLRGHNVTTADALAIFDISDLLDVLSPFTGGEPDRRIFLSMEAVRKNMYRTSGRD
jgi:hypothetical protein